MIQKIIPYLRYVLTILVYLSNGIENTQLFLAFVLDKIIKGGRIAPLVHSVCGIRNESFHKSKLIHRDKSQVNQISSLAT